MLAVRTIETDPQSPFGEGPPAEWTYKHVVRRVMVREAAAPGSARAWLISCGVDTLPPFPQGASLERTVRAYVNHGRWLWDCPICGSAQCCTPNDPRAFCVGCFNQGDGYWPVIFPDEALMADAVLLLERRPRMEDQNWDPKTEPIDALMLQNLSIGVDPDTPHDQLAGSQQALAIVREQQAISAPETPALEAAP